MSGNAPQRIDEDEEDRHAFVAVLSVVGQRCNWLCHAYQRRAQRPR